MENSGENDNFSLTSEKDKIENKKRDSKIMSIKAKDNFNCLVQNNGKE